MKNFDHLYIIYTEYIIVTCMIPTAIDFFLCLGRGRGCCPGVVVGMIPVWFCFWLLVDTFLRCIWSELWPLSSSSLVVHPMHREDRGGRFFFFCVCVKETAKTSSIDRRNQAGGDESAQGGIVRCFVSTLGLWLYVCVYIYTPSHPSIHLSFCIAGVFYTTNATKNVTTL